MYIRVYTHIYYYKVIKNELSWFFFRPVSLLIPAIRGLCRSDGGYIPARRACVKVRVALGTICNDGTKSRLHISYSGA